MTSVNVNITDVSVFTNYYLMEDPFTCEICHEIYTESYRIPLNLPCGHTLCDICIDEIKKHSPQFKCPYCKADVRDLNFPKSYQILKSAQLFR